jgi:uncharacterized iron-regulated membrane protein
MKHQTPENTADPRGSDMRPARRCIECENAIDEGTRFWIGVRNGLAASLVLWAAIIAALVMWLGR